MSSEIGQTISSTDSQHVRHLTRTLYSVAQKRWLWAVGMSYSAVLGALISIFFEFGTWVFGALVATAMLSLGGILFRWWSDDIRKHADRLLRMQDIVIGLGSPIDGLVVAEIEARYSRIISMAENTQEDKCSYFANTGTPSPRQLCNNMRESSWYTARLADVTKRRVYLIAAIGLVVPTVFLFAEATSVRVYGIIIGLTFCVDLFLLGRKYQCLSAASSEVHHVLSTLAKSDSLAERQIFFAATDYHIVRRTGPLVLTRLWQKQQQKLNAVWCRWLSEGRDAAGA